MPLSTPNFSWVGLALGCWGVRRFHDNMYMFSSPTYNLVYHKHLTRYIPILLYLCVCVCFFFFGWSVSAMLVALMACIGSPFGKKFRGNNTAAMVGGWIIFRCPCYSLRRRIYECSMILHTRVLLRGSITPRRLIGPNLVFFVLVATSGPPPPKKKRGCYTRNLVGLGFL